MDKKRHIIYLNVPEEKLVVLGEYSFGASQSLEGYDFLETTLIMLNSILGDEIYTKTSFIESVILDFDENKMTVKRQTKLSPVEDVHVFDDLSERYIEYTNRKKEVNEDEEIEKIYQIIRYKNDASQKLLDNFFLKKKSLFYLYDKFEKVADELKIRLKSCGLESDYNNFIEIVEAMNIKETIELYSDINEDNIDSFIETSTYDVANAIQLIDMIIKQVTEIITLAEIKIKLLDAETNKDIRNLPS